MSDIVIAKPKASALAVTAADFGGGIVVEGRDEGGIKVSRVAMYQGTAEEEARYGEHKRGVWLDTLECRELGNTIRIMPAFAWVEYTVWEEGEKQPTQKWESKRDVPAGMLEWKDGPNGKRIRPEVREAIYVVCIVQRKEGDEWQTEPWPYTLVFKSTGLKAWNGHVGPLENRRAASGLCPGLYELSSVDDKNENGQPFKRLTARLIGNPPEDVATLALMARRAKDSVKAAAVAQPAESEDGFDPDAH